MSPTELPLRDIHLPPEIGFFPVALGWWILLLIVPILAGFSFWLYRRLTRKTAVKTAKKLLLALKTSDKATAEKLAELAILLRRVAISVSSRSECASLTGKAWLAYLDNSLKDKSFSEGVGQCLADVNYHKNAAIEVDMTALWALAERWLKAQKSGRS